MHMQGEPRTMQLEPTYDDVVSEVAAFLEERVRFAVEAGIAEERICIDPGIGFGKTVAQNFELVRRLEVLTSLGRPVLIGLAYVLLWEGLLGNLLASTRELSIHQYAVTLASRIAQTQLLHNHVGLPVAIVMSAVFLVGGTVLAVNRLSSFAVTGETS